MSFGPTGPFHFQAPQDFDDKKENFEEISFNFKSYLSLMNPACTAVMNNIEASLEPALAEAPFNDEDRNVQATRIHLATLFQMILVSLCTGSASAALRRVFRNWI